MRTEQAWLVVAGAVALASLLAALLAAMIAWRVARRALARVEDLSARVAAQEAAPPPTSAGAVPAPREPATPYVITGLDTATPVPSATIEGRLFADVLARESAVRAAAWSHGVRRALAPESRNRIRFQVRQQAKQARRDRRSEVKEALREYRARHRAEPADAPADASADGDAA